MYHLRDSRVPTKSSAFRNQLPPHSNLVLPLLVQPINADGNSVFSAKGGVVQVKFTLTQYNPPTCTLLPATIAITKASDGTLTSTGSGTNFRIQGCQYAYNLRPRSFGVGTYRVDISIQGIMVGHAVFALK